MFVCNGLVTRLWLRYSEMVRDGLVTRLWLGEQGESNVTKPPVLCHLPVSTKVCVGSWLGYDQCYCNSSTLSQVGNN